MATRRQPGALQQRNVRCLISAGDRSAKALRARVRDDLARRDLCMRMQDTSIPMQILLPRVAKKRASWRRAEDLCCNALAVVGGHESCIGLEERHPVLPLASPAQQQGGWDPETGSKQLPSLIWVKAVRVMSCSQRWGVHPLVLPLLLLRKRVELCIDVLQG
jgi:hypothetical protein